jgi:hypothetical protein
MEGFGHPTQRERLKVVASILRRVYSPDPCHVPEHLKECIRRLKELPDATAEREIKKRMTR